MKDPVLVATTCTLLRCVSDWAQPPHALQPMHCRLDDEEVTTTGSRKAASSEPQGWASFHDRSPPEEVCCVLCCRLHTTTIPQLLLPPPQQLCSHDGCGAVRLLCGGVGVGVVP